MDNWPGTTSSLVDNVVNLKKNWYGTLNHTVLWFLYLNQAIQIQCTFVCAWSNLVSNMNPLFDDRRLTMMMVSFVCLFVCLFVSLFCFFCLSNLVSNMDPFFDDRRLIMMVVPSRYHMSRPWAGQRFIRSSKHCHVQHHLKRYVACMDVIRWISRQIQIRNRNTQVQILHTYSPSPCPQTQIKMLNANSKYKYKYTSSHTTYYVHTYSPSPHNGDTMRRRRGRARRWKKEENNISLVDSDTRKKHQSSPIKQCLATYVYKYEIYTSCGHLYRRTLTLAMLPPGSDWRVRRARSPPPLMCPTSFSCSSYVSHQLLMLLLCV